VYLAVSRLLNPDSVVEGWTFITAGMFLLGGIQMLMLGVLGQYIGRIYEEVQARPLYAFAVAEHGPLP
jgi:dolichol-phosphate mannosyltransferase